jgi:competence ComEA-like helix-hairpin-helix protein
MDALQQRSARKANPQNKPDPSSYQFDRSLPGGFREGELFPFDPNSITAEDWERLGLNERTAKTITNYVGKGGRFRKPDDLQKIWGMPAGFYERIKPYVRIETTKREYPVFENNARPPKEERKPSLININEADSTALIALPGIGSRLSARIITFREKLGGFFTVEQVGETYGLPDSTFQKIRHRLQADESTIRKMNLNTASKDELKAHPYIHWNLANAIVAYRNQHGPFSSLEDLKNIVLIDDALFRKISPYFRLQD